MRSCKWGSEETQTWMRGKLGIGVPVALSPGYQPEKAREWVRRCSNSVTEYIVVHNGSGI